MQDLFDQVFHANMELFHRKLIVYTWGNVSQVDREKGIMVIKPSGVPYETMTADQMVAVSLEDGKVVSGNLRPSSDAPTHLVLYRAFPEIGGITHTHSPNATAWAQAGKSLPCYGTTHADYFYGDVPITRFMTEEEILRDYEVETGNVIVEAFIVKNPKHVPGVFAYGHGPFTWGKDAMDSVHNAVVLEEIAKMGLNTLLLNPNAKALPQAMQDKHFLRKHGAGAYYGQGNK